MSASTRFGYVLGALIGFVALAWVAATGTAPTWVRVLASIDCVMTFAGLVIRAQQPPAKPTT